MALGNLAPELAASIAAAAAAAAGPPALADGRLPLEADIWLPAMPNGGTSLLAG